MYNVINKEITSVGRFEIEMDTVLKNAKKYPYSFIHMYDGVTVLVIHDDKIVLLKEYRHAIKSWEYEFPSGMINENENPKDAAVREVKEETGLEVEDIISLGYTYPSFGSTTEKIYLYVAKCIQNASENEQKELDALEELEVVELERKEVQKMILDNSFKHAAGIVAWMKYFMK